MKKPNQKKSKFTRHQIYELVWGESIKAITDKYLISYKGFREICNKYNIPLPPNGYWTKIKFNKPFIHTPLPEVESSTISIELFLREEGDDRNLNILNKLQKLKFEIESDPHINLTVPKKLPKNPDVITRQTLKGLTERLYEPSNFYDYTERFELGTIPINITEVLIKRCLRIMNALIVAIKARGHTFSFSKYEAFVVIQGIEIELRFREKHKRIKNPESEHSWETSDLKPTGKLSLITDKYFYKKEWSDTKTIPLEHKLSKIIAHLELTAKRELDWKIKNEKEREERGRKEKIEREIVEVREKELEKLKNLIEESNQWHKAENFRKFLHHKEQRAIITGTLTEELIKLLSWAKEKADWMDPLMKKDNNIFKDIDLKL